MYSATFSPEDAKLRLYADSRLDAETYAQAKALGFQWAPKQELFVAPAWTPAREDFLLDLAGEIDDEDYSPQERAADRAERFSDYRDRRLSEATAGADRFESGPAAFGHQNRDRAERQAARHDRHRTRAVSQWGKAEYWQGRTAAVISHALFRSSAKVRRGRILRIEADQRKHEKTRAEYAERFAGWQAVPTLDGADRAGRYVDGDGKGGGFYGFDPETMTPALRAAYALANSGQYSGQYNHPRTGHLACVFTHLTEPRDPITPAEAAALWLDRKPAPDDPDSYAARWTAHYALRLEYERSMLAAEGGTAADADMEPGGWIGSNQIHAVNRSPVTKRVVSVKLMAPKRWYRGTDTAPMTLQSFNVERLPEGAYRAPTEAERAEFATVKAERKATEKATKPKAPPLVNPTDDDAERLQALWNDREKQRIDRANAEGRCLGDFKPSAVVRTTQAKYSELSKGSYTRFETVDVCEHGHRPKRQYGSNVDPSPIAFKVRKASGANGGLYYADRVVILTDKPQKPIPLDWDNLDSPAQTAPAVAVVAEPAAEPEPEVKAETLVSAVSTVQGVFQWA